jgi:DNA repair exonuclease SbcCD ATPase subunit
MEPVRLQLENFIQHSKSDISFDDFSSALIIGKIKGSEKFSNGAGKSSIFSAIKYVLFNEIEFSILDKVIRHGEDYCKVIFDFRLANNEVWRIQRSRNKTVGSEVRLFKKVNNEWFDSTSRRNTDTEKDIAKLIKVNCKTFCNSVLFSQADLSGLASLSPEKRKLALKEVLQLNVYSKYEAAAKKRAADLAKDIDREKTIASTFGAPVEDIKKFEQELSLIDKTITDKNERKLLIEKDYNNEYQFAKEQSEKFEAIKRQAQDALSRQKTLQEEAQKLSFSIKEYENKILLIKNTGKSLKDEVNEIETFITKMNDLKYRDKDIVKKDIEDISKTIIDKKSKQISISSEIEELKIPLPTGGICKYCRQPTDLKARDICQEQINAELIVKETDLKSIKLELVQLDLNGKNLKEEISNIENRDHLLSSKKASFEVKNKELETKRSIYNEYATMIDNCNSTLIEKYKELEDIRKNQFLYSPEEYAKMKTDLNNTNIKINSIEKVLDDMNKEIQALSNNQAVFSHKINERKNDLDKITICNEKISELESKSTILQEVIRAFGSKGIPALITHTILDDFQNETNILLSQFRPGMQAQFSVIKEADSEEKDTLNIGYILNGQNVEYEQLSGAQKFISVLSLKLGLAAVMKRRLGAEIKFLLIDEVDQSLDEGSLETFEEAIKKLQQEYKILIITHNNELKLKFNYAILVEQDEKFVSTAKVVNTW